MSSDSLTAEDTIPVYVVIGSDPEEPARPLEIFMDAEPAARYVLNGLMQSMMMLSGGVLEGGDQVSLIVTIGKDGNDDQPEQMTVGGAAVIGKQGRRAWDFRVEKRWAPR